MNKKEKIKELLVDFELADKEIQEIQQKIETLQEEIMEEDDSFVKCTCPQCSGNGNIKKENKRIICPTCKGNKYIWMNKYES